MKLNQVFAGKKVYYAHPITEYNTPVEAKIEDKFESLCPDAKVTNPNQPQHSQGYKDEGWEYFDKLVKKHDAVVFTCHSDGSIGAGVFKEVDALLKRGCPGVFADPRTQEFIPVDKEDFAKFKALDVPATRALIKEERALKETEDNPFANMQAFGESVSQSNNLGFLAGS